MSTLIQCSPVKSQRSTHIKQIQDKYAHEKPKGLHRRSEHPTLWINEQQEVWIPDGARELQLGLYAIAHQHVGGHRGQKATLAKMLDPETRK